MNELSMLWHAAVDWLANGLADASWWQIVLFTLATTHVTIAAVTIFLHRSQAHRALDLHAIPAHFFRFWLWLTTGMATKEWVAIHRKHHAKCETADDPHSPQTFGIRKVLLEGAELYRTERRFDEAEPLYDRALAIDEKTLGRDHPSLALGLNNLAALQFDKGAYVRAEELLKRALTIEEEALGETDPELITTLENYAAVLRELRRHDEADEIESRANTLRAQL